MKMFKKLMAVALAGVMALAVLTGCGSSVNEKEIISMINDIQKTPWVQNILDKNDLKATTYKAADADVKQKTAAVAELVQKDVKKEDTIEKILKDKHDHSGCERTLQALGHAAEPVKRIKLHEGAEYTENAGNGERCTVCAVQSDGAAELSKHQ